MATPWTRPQIEEQKVEALRLWMTGASSEAIADQLTRRAQQADPRARAVSRTTAWRRVWAAIDDMRPHADYDAYRATQLAELEVARRVCRRIIASYGTNRAEPTPIVLSSMRELVRLQEREARLLNLDKAPAPFEDILRMSDEELERMVFEWAEEAAAEGDPVLIDA